MAPARKSPPKKSAKRRSKPAARKRRAARPVWHLPVLQQHHRDLMGLGLVALGVFLAFPLYMDVEGGAAGGATVDALEWLAGRIAYAAPVAVALTGAIMVLRPVMPAVRPLRTGAVCLFAATTLGLAAGTLGIGPSGHAPLHFEPAYFEERGGIVGDALYYGASEAVSDIGAHIAAVFLFCAGLLLVTGASVAGMLRAAGSGVADTTRAVRQVVPVVPARMSMHPPEPEDEEPVIRKTPRKKKAQLDGATRYPDIFGDESDGLSSADRVEFSPPETEDDDIDDPLAGSSRSELPMESRSDSTLPDVVPGEPDVEPVAVEEPEEIPEEQRKAGKPVFSAEDLTPQGRYRGSVTDDPDFHWELPSPLLLERSNAAQSKPDTAGQAKTAQALVEALEHFKVSSKIVGTVAGPHITRFELRLAPGIKMSKVAQLKDDLAYALAATDIRILAPIPGKTAVGVEVPNLRRRVVKLGDVFEQAPKSWSPMTVWLGKDVSGKPIPTDLSKMPHLLVAGTTGAGKSGCINAMLCSILLRATPHDLRLVLIDPKQVELNHYESIPHLLTPVITSPRMAANALQNLVREMEQRYSIMSLAKTRSLNELNKVRAGRGEPDLPYILCVIDELADLMMVAPADVEDSIIRLAQKARAVGIHLVLATQSPRVDVITGMIKANVPSRIAFSVSSQTDSRVILDQNGAESLLGQGDMLFSPVGSSRLQRIQGAYIDEPQIEALTSFWRKQGEPELREDLLEEVEAENADPGPGSHEEGFSPDEDALLEDAIRLVAEMQTASTSMLQRRLRLGYTRAGRLIDMLERRGVISGYEGSKPRQVLVGEGDVDRFLANLRERDGGSGEPTGVASGMPEPGSEPLPE